MQIYSSVQPHAQLIAMLHVNSNNALANTAYTKFFGIQTYSASELKILTEIRLRLGALSKQVIAETGIEILQYCRNASFVLKEQEVLELEHGLKTVRFVWELIERALKEVEIYARNGINYIEIENVGAPYFIGNEVPLEDLLIQLIVAKSIRKAYPEMHLGIQVLSSNELEALPIAICVNAFFIRSESSVFKGLRPEGEIINRGNLAKAYYLRNFLTASKGLDDFEKRRLPQIWCDVQKKHTVFNMELTEIKTWLDVILFQKIEGIVLTGSETGADISEKDLAQAHEAIQRTSVKINELTGNASNHKIPLVTGSGNNLDMYLKYTDFVISGTALKKNNYWENEVNEENVKIWVERFYK